jgi:ABC-type nickel/cobalt efflux system permease component RcnA
MRRARRATLPLLAAIGAMALGPAAFAHPLGNFTVNASASIVVAPGSVRIDYVLDLAEIPTVQAMGRLDADGDGRVGADERSAWAAGTAEELLGGLTLAADGTPVALELRSAAAELAPGQGGLEVLRLDATFTGPIAAGSGSLTYRDANHEDRVGWREITASGIDGVALEGSSVPVSSPSASLRSYPEDLLSSPLDVREATLSFAPGASAPASDGNVGTGSTSRPGAPGGAFADLVGQTGPLMVVALLLAFGFGALHALGPGHGKALMAAYLVGAGGRVRQAVAVGGAVAVMHTASVLALGFAVLTATELFAPERVYPWLGLGSGLVALGLGAGLLVARLGSWGSHGDGPGHSHDHSAAHAHDHGHGQGHGHPHVAPSGPVLSRRGLGALAVAGGILPSPTALVVLLASVAFGRVVYGMALIGAFSLGLAAALVAVGAVAIRARDLVARRASGRLARLVPIASAAAIAVVGLVLTVNGAAQL